MAAIDKIYVNNYEQYIQFKDWCKVQPKLLDKYGIEVPLTRFLYKYDEPFDSCRPVFCAPYYVDAYVIKNCPFDFIQEELMVNYGHWSQKTVDEAYQIVMDRGGVEGKEGERFYWLTKDDFEVVDGVVKLYREESDYEKIKRGYLYNMSITGHTYTAGKHFKCTKHPAHMYNTPFKCKSYWINVYTPEGLPSMWYHENHNSWDFSDEFVVSEWSSSDANCKTIRALKRLMRKWCLPVGTIVRATGRYASDDYCFLITK